MREKLSVKKIINLIDEVNSIEDYDILSRSITKTIRTEEYSDFEKDKINNALDNKKNQL